MKASRNLIWTLAILLILMLAACSGSDKSAQRNFAFLNDAGINVDDGLLLSDTLALPDVYCGDKNQTADDLKGKPLNSKQYAALIEPVGHGFPEPMSNWMLLGVRDIGGITLAAYYACNGMGYNVDMVTYDKQGHVLDAINMREMHLVWRRDLSRADDNTSFTLDSHITFNGAGQVTLHRVMGCCQMDYEGDLKGKPQWQQAWDQAYDIDAKGQFVLQGQQVVNESGMVDYYATMDFRCWDMLVCSLHDPSVMDTWNDYAQVVNATYDPEYHYNPFAIDVAELYEMNPQRFLRWMALKRDHGNRLLRYFKLPADKRPALREEITRLGDPSAEQWLSGIVNSWDDKPLTNHL